MAIHDKRKRRLRRDGVVRWMPVALGCFAAVATPGESRAAEAVRGSDVGGASTSQTARRMTQIGPTVSHLPAGSPGRPKLYDNTVICSPNVQSLAVGGLPPNPMSLRDWFVSSGGPVTGFDVFVMNSGPIAVPNSLWVTFYEGTNAHVLGTVIEDAVFRSLGSPPLAPIPVWEDPNTGGPGLMRVSVDYEAETFNIVGLFEDPPGSGILAEVQLSPKDQFIGEVFGRLPFDLPAGAVGVDVRLVNEPSLCNGGDPVAGPVLASGGSGTEDGLHIIGVYSLFGSANCSVFEYALLCDDPGWEPLVNVSCDEDADCEEVFGPGAACLGTHICDAQASVPCTGGDLCALDLPSYGIALTLYGGANEDADGNNEINTADLIDTDAPAPCSSTLTTVSGFIGDNGTPIGAGTPVDLFDADGDGDVDLLDWRDFQRCFGQGDPPSPPLGKGGKNPLSPSLAKGGKNPLSPSLAKGGKSPLSPPLAKGGMGGVGCVIHDANGDGAIDLADYAGSGDGEVGFQACFSGDVSSPDFQPPGPQCVGEVPPDPILLQDVDLYELPTAPGRVVSVAVEGFKGPMGEPLWDPHLRVFGVTAKGIEELARSGDFDRFSRDAFTTVAVPPGVGTLYFGVSASIDTIYDPQVPDSIGVLNADDAGGYTLSVVQTEPECVQDDGGGEATDCYASKHEPDDTLDDADARGDAMVSFIVGAVGDGAFAETGQDVDIYRLSFSGDLAGARSVSVRVTGAAKPGGFETVFDLAMALYDSSGTLVACGDQASVAVLNGADQSRPQLAANVDGTDLGGDGIYYLAIFGTDRGLFNANGVPVFPAAPPSILNIPAGPDLPGTADSDLRPFVGGRVNRPGSRLVGRAPPNDPPPADASLQCYHLLILPAPTRLGTTGPDDPDESASPVGNDSIPDASDSVAPSDRLAGGAVTERFLGNGFFGGWQGDVDFYRVQAAPGQLVAVNVADAEPPPDSGQPVRSYLALFDAAGRAFAGQDYSLERYSPFAGQDVSDQIAATVVGVVPPSDDAFVYAMVGIDAGNLLLRENVPFDSFLPGTTLSRRFETSTVQARAYGIGIAVIDPASAPNIGGRAFAVVRRGVDRFHTEPFVNDPSESNQEQFPPIIEIDPATGRTLRVLNAEPDLFTFRRPLDVCFANPDGCPARVSANPAIGYDSETLFVTVETCTAGALPCPNLTHPLFRINPDLRPGDDGFVMEMGEIEGLPDPFDAVLTGLVERDGVLFALDTTSNTLRFWDKGLAPTADAGGLSEDLVLFSGTDPGATVFDDVDGDLAADASFIYMGCSLNGGSVGICRFAVSIDPDGTTATVSFAGPVPDPVTHNGLTVGPRLGGFDVADNGVLIATDRNGPMIQYLDPATDQVTGLDLPPGYVIERLTIR